MEGSTSFSPSHYFPQRRRVVQACLTCSKRKTRCDGARPKCGWCSTQNLECIYRDSQQPRIDANTRILLERIQLLEDRLLSSVTPQANQSGLSSLNPLSIRDLAGSPEAENPQDNFPRLQQQDEDLGVHISLSHTANANHVYGWPIVRQLLGEPAFTNTSPDATDVFFEPSFATHSTTEIPNHWRLFDGNESLATEDLVARYRDLIRVYFSEVNIFFPLLSLSQIQRDFEDVVRQELVLNQEKTDMSTTRYTLLILVLCLSTFVSSGESRISLNGESYDPHESHSQGRLIWDSLAEERLWGKAKILLGSLSSESTIQAGQCAMLASFYMGAKGRVSDSFHWAHTAAVICEAITRRAVIKHNGGDQFSDTFRRLYWVALIYESDFVSEISITLPSGIARYEDVVPYPVIDMSAGTEEEASSPNSQNIPAATNDGSEPASTSRLEELVAFQISTNAAIRRFLNRVNNFVYDSKEQYRMARADYATWLLRVTGDLWSHHSAIYRNLPDFLLTSRTDNDGSNSGASPSTPGFIRTSNLGNDPWNVLRLKGRYYAGQYIIHRPFIEYVLLDLANIAAHPNKAAILEKCRMCLEGCRGFIKVFDVDVANSITCLFASGMVTFTMVIILRVCTIRKEFSGILPDDVEEVIYLGKRNIQRFSVNIKEFKWHLDVLERLERAKDSQAAFG
ncbi:hypothetical protein F5Y04DRAFT_250333 [Hypomontagnella monticulosa]|nr:hypothetical protein F5Y04DRAFT_250333 [Hypomontagnella monticulosa]